MSTTIKDGRIITRWEGMEFDDTDKFRSVILDLISIKDRLGGPSGKLDGRTSVQRVVMAAQDIANEFGWLERQLPYRTIGYTAEECEREMRRLTNGERGCSNPDEHEGSSSPHMAIDI